MRLHINRYEHKEYLENLLGICPLCAIEAMTAEIEFVLEFHEDDDPSLDIAKLTDEEIAFGACK